MNLPVMFFVSFCAGFVLVAGFMLIRHELRTRASRPRPVSELERARAAGRRDVLNGWMRWARNRDSETGLEWDDMNLRYKLMLLNMANRRADKFEAGPVLVSDEWRLHSNPDIRNAYLVGASDAAGEITTLRLNVYRGQEESARQGRKISADIEAIRELDPAASKDLWEGRFHE